MFIKDLTSQTVKVGENIKLECQVLNSLIVEWFYDDMQITVAEGTEIVFDRETGLTSLSIENICPEDAGDYTVRAINDAGVSSKSARLNVEGKIYGSDTSVAITVYTLDVYVNVWFLVTFSLLIIRIWKAN